MRRKKRCGVALPRADLPIFTLRNLQDMIMGGVTALVVQQRWEQESGLSPISDEASIAPLKFFCLFSWLW